MLKIISNQKIPKMYYKKRLQPLLNKLNLKGTIVIKIGDAQESRHLNSTYRKKNRATDVLSFLYRQKFPDGYYIGDIFICHEIACAQAEDAGISLEEELLTLMIHGLLHLAEYDHETDQGEMMALQNQFLNELAEKIPDK
jgi:probable rRNA maturation factor